jgi:hypothetical protein
MNICLVSHNKSLKRKPKPWEWQWINKVYATLVGVLRVLLYVSFCKRFIGLPFQIFKGHPCFVTLHSCFAKPKTLLKKPNSLAAS